MRSLDEIRNILDELNNKVADEFEDQDLDFKELTGDSKKDKNLIVAAAVCMANGGGGTIVLGVRERVKGREVAIRGVPPKYTTNDLKRWIHDKTIPKLAVEFEELHEPEGTLLVIQVRGDDQKIYTDTSGAAKSRNGKECDPLDGSERLARSIVDISRQTLRGSPSKYISISAMEELRKRAKAEHVPADLLQADDIDLLKNLGVIKKGRLTLAGLFISGKEEEIEEHLPGYGWTYLRFQSDTHYSNRADGKEALPLAVARIAQFIEAGNTVTTIAQGPLGIYHYEYKTYPEIAIREALLNAFCHQDFGLSSRIMIRHYPNKLEISNPGSFLGGVTPENILHHSPVDRNPHLVETLLKLHLVNRANLGIERMFKAMLIEGREQPIIVEHGSSVRVIFDGTQMSNSFRNFTKEESDKGLALSVDHLLILQHLTKRPEIDTEKASTLIQRSRTEARDLLHKMEAASYLARGGSGRGTYWRLDYSTHKRIAAASIPEKSRRLSKEAVMTRILTILQERSENGNGGLSNAEIRVITSFSRDQVLNLMRKLMEQDKHIKLIGKTRGAMYVYQA